VRLAVYLQEGNTRFRASARTELRTHRPPRYYASDDEAASTAALALLHAYEDTPTMGWLCKILRVANCLRTQDAWP